MKHNKALFFASAVAGVLTANVSLVQANIQTFDALVNGPNAVPPTTSTATGSLSIQYDDVTSLFDIQIMLIGIEGEFDPSGQNIGLPIPSGAHIHLGVPGVASDTHIYNTDATVWQHVDSSNNPDGVDLDFNSIDDPMSGNWNYSATGVPLINGGTPDDLNGKSYLNIHTSTGLTGELRGDIGLVPEPATLAMVLVGGILVCRRVSRLSLGKGCHRS